jgi:hypothetical protein
LPVARAFEVGVEESCRFLDRPGHLMPGNEDEAVALVDAYLERATIV